jgi:hypothetical protein
LPDINDLLREVGCPYRAETAEAVIWLHGYRAGVAKAARAVDAEIERTFEDHPTVIPLSTRRRK